MKNNRSYMTKFGGCRQTRQVNLLAWALAAILGSTTTAMAGGQSIYALVNDEPISAYDVQQRVNFLMMGSNAITKRMRSAMRAPDIQERFRKFAIKHRPKTQAEVKALQRKFVAQIRRNVEGGVRPKVRSQAVRELINERLKLQEAKRLSIVVGQKDVDQYLTGLAKRNKQTVQQFKQTLTKRGVNIATLKQRLKSQLAWRNVIRRRYGRQISIGNKDIDRIMAGSTGEGGDEVELQLHRITLPLSGKIDQAIMAARFADADSLRRRFKSCKNTAALAKSIKGAKFQNLGRKRIDSLPVDARPILHAAKPGQMTPPVFTTSGVYLYAVCERRTVTGNSKQRVAARQKLEQEQFASFAKRLLRDLCNDAFIEFRGGKAISRRCGEG